jgi:hypothetical protein
MVGYGMAWFVMAWHGDGMARYVMVGYRMVCYYDIACHGTVL